MGDRIGRTETAASFPAARRPLHAGAGLFLVIALAACGGGSEAPSSGDRTAAKRSPQDTPSPSPTGAQVAGYTVAEVPGGGRIAGHVGFEGTPPEPKPVVITKDRSVCGATGHTSEKLVVGEGGGVRYAVVSIEGISRGKAFPGDQRPTIDQRGCWFIPHVVTVPAGAEIDILNSDGILHNLHTYPSHNPAINVAQPKFKKRITQSFASPDRVRIACDVHSWMGAWIVVTAHPYHAVTAADGSYTLDDVPPGSYTVSVWHETLGTREHRLTVAAGDTAEADFTFRE